MDILRIGKNTLKLLSGKQIRCVLGRNVYQSEHRDVEKLDPVSKVNALAQQKYGSLP